VATWLNRSIQTQCPRWEARVRRVRHMVTARHARRQEEPLPQDGAHSRGPLNGGDAPLGTQSPGKAMEVAVMSLSAREQQALDSIEDGLSGADPKLASLLATFTRLTAGEEMPVPEKIRAARRSATRLRHRPHRGPMRRERAPTRLTPGLVAAGLWLLIPVAIIAVALALSRGGGNGPCTVPWGTVPQAAACAAQQPGTLHPAARKQTLPSRRRGSRIAEESTQWNPAGLHGT
jgi:Protein of unknown function (DUF3040)